MKTKLFITSLCFLFLTLSVWAVDDSATGLLTISGYLKDAANGEALIGATISVRELSTGTSANQYGFYSLSLKSAKYLLEYRYLGYQTIQKTIDLNQNITLNVELIPDESKISEVIVTAVRPDANVKKAEMCISKLEMKTIKQVPSLMGGSMCSR